MMIGTEIISARGMTNLGRSISPAIVDIESKPEYIQTPTARPRPMLLHQVSPLGRNGCSGVPCQCAKPSTVMTMNGATMMTVKMIELRATRSRPRMLIHAKTPMSTAPMSHSSHPLSCGHQPPT